MTKIKKTLGGERLGSGNKMKVDLHGYGRSSFNISRYFKTDQAAGTLVPYFVDVATDGTDYYIDLTTMVRTLPTNGPIFGSFKHQIDVFSIPIRLYNAQLHNNALNIGLNMEKVLLPQVSYKVTQPKGAKENPNANQIAQDSLTAYLGLRGLGTPNANTTPKRNFPAIFELAYWDIYKNYYANKQEKNAYVISGNEIQGQMTNATATSPREDAQGKQTTTFTQKKGTIDGKAVTAWTTASGPTQYLLKDNIDTYMTLTRRGKYDEIVTKEEIENIANNAVWVKKIGTATWQTEEINGSIYVKDAFKKLEINNLPGEDPKQAKAAVFLEPIETILITPNTLAENSSNAISGVMIMDATTTELQIEEFELTNIDKMREAILGAPSGAPFNVTEQNIMPYNATSGLTQSQEKNRAFYTQAGLGLRTYLSDRFNNWLSTEWIDGVNGINEISAAEIVDGKLRMDSLILSKKVYEMMNRIAIGGGSYNDWREVVYGRKATFIPESPVFEGGMSSEITFDEVVSSAASQNIEGEMEPLGSLAGRGSDKAFKGGKKIHVHIDEPSILMIIGSIVPRITYSQGNKWYMELETMNDLHKPALDGIGFQDLITEEMAAWTTLVNNDGSTEKSSVGKQPAWIEQQTNVDESFGSFSAGESLEFMSLNRKYSRTTPNGLEIDATTYIDPTMYNAAFAQGDITAKNFWVQCQIDCIARRVMSAKQIPNL